MREYRFDVARVVCMTYIIAFMHLYAYIYPEGRNTFYIPVCVTMTDACLGLFTFISGYLLGKKYVFGKCGNCDWWTFYKKRLLRIIPLFVIASIVLWLIDFNEITPTRNGILCISPFVNPKPRTLWYIPVILWCYIVTPLVSRNSMRWRFLSSICVFALLLIARSLFPSVDERMIYNLFFYLTGIYMASCLGGKCNNTYFKYLKVLYILSFVLLISFGLYYSLLYRPSYIFAVGGLGVFALLFICEGISKLVYYGQNAHHGSLRNIASFVIEKASYASMACYMFHRFFYWAAEKIWNPSDTSVKWLFMACCVYPIIVVSSYVIQKVYDDVQKHI